MHIAAQNVAQIVIVLPQKSKTGLLLSGLIAPLNGIHAQYTRLFFLILSERFKRVSLGVSVRLCCCGNNCFVKQVMTHTKAHLLLKPQ